MIKYEFSSLLRKLRCNSRGVTFKHVAATIQYANKAELQELFEIINSTNDSELQIKLFSIIAAYLVTNGTYTESIVKCRSLYDRVQEILNSGLRQRTAQILNFVTALLSINYEEDERRKNLVLQARNMIRVSGCLATMASLFAESIMSLDTWVALCHCLAEACRDSEMNQSYCTHLVPLSVKRCHQESAVLELLQSLLHDHDRNVQLFLECNGVAIFTREMLQYDVCMQLLNTLIQNCSVAIALLHEHKVIDHLRDFLHSYGPQSRIGQWSTIILYNLRLLNKGTEVTTEPTINNNESFNKLPNKSLFNDNTRDDTEDLIQNVFKEIVNWKLNKDSNFRKPKCFPEPNNMFARRSHLNPPRVHQNERTSLYNNLDKAKVCPRNVPPSQNGKDETVFRKSATNLNKDKLFSYVFEHDLFQRPEKRNKITREQNSSLPKRTKSCASQTADNAKMRATSMNRQENISNAFSIVNNESGTESVTQMEFKPPFVSTPKKVDNVRLSHTSQLYKLSQSYRGSFINNTKRVNKVHKPYKLRKRNETASHMKEISHNKSFSARFFSAINDSCVALVKSVKKIFKTKEKVVNGVTEATHLKTDVSVDTCGYSFTNYMRRRDAVLAKECTMNLNMDYDDYSNKACKTCDDTTMLKHKMDNNKHLERTVKKLKLGINLYGCDFKKISKTMWPREAYMTPSVLYNIYRKLIVK